MKTIWKYEIPIDDKFTLELPKNAMILTVQTQYEKPNIWCLVDPEQPTEKRYFRLAGTGHPLFDNIERKLRYIGTFQLNDGAFLGHLFEIDQSPPFVTTVEAT